jgi:hypothetical protein
MSVTALRLDPGAQARALLHHLLEAGDIIGKDAAGRTVIQLAAADWLLDRLMTFDAGAEDLEDGGDAEDDGPAVLSFDWVPARRVCRGRRATSSKLVPEHHAKEDHGRNHETDQKHGSDQQW